MDIFNGVTIIVLLTWLCLYMFVFDEQVNQDFLLLFGEETATKLLEKWDTSFKPKVIKEAKRLTQSTQLCRLIKAAEKLTENYENGTLHSMLI